MDPFEAETERLRGEGLTDEEIALRWIALDPTAEVADDPDDVEDDWDHSEWRADEVAP